MIVIDCRDSRDCRGCRGCQTRPSQARPGQAVGCLPLALVLCCKERRQASSRGPPSGCGMWASGRVDEAQWIRRRASSRQVDGVDCVDAQVHAKVGHCVALAAFGWTKHGRAEQEQRGEGEGSTTASVYLDVVDSRKCLWLSTVHLSWWPPSNGGHMGRQAHKRPRSQQGQVQSNCANVTERWSVNVTTACSALRGGNGMGRAAAGGGVGGQQSSPGRQGRLQLPQGNRQAPTPQVQGPRRYLARTRHGRATPCDEL